MLPIFLRDIDNVIPVLHDTGLARELLLVAKKAAPLRLEQVDNIKIFSLRLGVAPLRGQKMHV